MKMNEWVSEWYKNNVGPSDSMVLRDRRDEVLFDSKEKEKKNLHAIE